MLWKEQANTVDVKEFQVASQVDLTDPSNFHPIPDNTLPLFGDVYLALPKDIRSILTKVYIFESKQHILSSQMPFTNFLPLNTTDPLYNNCLMHLMIKEAFRNGKEFVCAKVSSRVGEIGQGEEQEAQDSGCRDQNKHASEAISLVDECKKFFPREGSQLTCNYYNAFSILNAVVRRRDGQLVGRFEQDNGMTVLDPITGNRIYGEIELFIIENPFKEDKDVLASGKPISLNGLSGSFIGTDHTFLHSSKLQDTIMSQCIEQNKETYLKFPVHQRLNYTVRQLLNQDENQYQQQNIRPESLQQYILNMSEENQRALYEMYVKYKSLRDYAVLGFLQGLSVIISITSSCFAFLALTQPKYDLLNYDPLLALNMYSLTAPIFQLLHESRTLHLHIPNRKPNPCLNLIR